MLRSQVVGLTSRNGFLENLQAAGAERAEIQRLQADLAARNADAKAAEQWVRTGLLFSVCRPLSALTLRCCRVSSGKTALARRSVPGATTRSAAVTTNTGASLAAKHDGSASGTTRYSRAIAESIDLTEPWMRSTAVRISACNAEDDPVFFKTPRGIAVVMPALHITAGKVGFVHAIGACACHQSSMLFLLQGVLLAHVAPVAWAFGLLPNAAPGCQMPGCSHAGAARAPDAPPLVLAGCGHRRCSTCPVLCAPCRERLRELVRAAVAAIN